MLNLKQSYDEEEVKYNPVTRKKELKYIPNMEIKTETGTTAYSDEDLSVAQEQVSLVKSLITKTVKLEAEVLEKSASLEELRREMAENKNTLEADDFVIQRLAQRFTAAQEEKLGLQQKIECQEEEKRSMQTRFDERELESAAIRQRFADAARRQEEEKRSLQARFDQLEAESAAMSQRFAEEERRLREENFELKQKLDLEVKHRVAIYRHVSSSNTLLDANGGEIAQTQVKKRPAVKRVNVQQDSSSGSANAVKRTCAIEVQKKIEDQQREANSKKLYEELKEGPRQYKTITRKIAVRNPNGTTSDLNQMSMQQITPAKPPESPAPRRIEVIQQQNLNTASTSVINEKALLAKHPPGTVLKCIIAQIMQTASGPRIVLQGLQGTDTSPQQSKVLHERVKQQLLKAQESSGKAGNEMGPIKIYIAIHPRQ